MDKVKAKSYKMQFFYSGVAGGYGGEYDNIFISRESLPTIAKKFKDKKITIKMDGGHPNAEELANVIEESDAIISYIEVDPSGENAFMYFATENKFLQDAIDKQGWLPSTDYMPIYKPNSSGVFVNDYNGAMSDDPIKIAYDGEIIDIDDNYLTNVAIVINPRYKNVQVINNSQNEKKIKIMLDNKNNDNDNDKIFSKTMEKTQSQGFLAGFYQGIKHAVLNGSKVDPEEDLKREVADMKYLDNKKKKNKEEEDEKENSEEDAEKSDKFEKKNKKNKKKNEEKEGYTKSNEEEDEKENSEDEDEDDKENSEDEDEKEEKSNKKNKKNKKNSIILNGHSFSVSDIESLVIEALQNREAIKNEKEVIKKMQNSYTNPNNNSQGNIVINPSEYNNILKGKM